MDTLALGIRAKAAIEAALTAEQIPRVTQTQAGAAVCWDQQAGVVEVFYAGGDTAAPAPDLWRVHVRQALAVQGYDQIVAGQMPRGAPCVRVTIPGIDPPQEG